MKRISEKLTCYVIKTGVVSEESYAIYQYGFQIGLEMLCCFVICLGVAIYMHMILEFIVLTGIFMLLRSYAGGVHLNSFVSCFICSVTVQTVILLINKLNQLPLGIAWGIILVSAVLIQKLAPVETENRKLDRREKEHCKKMVIKILVCITIFAVCCTVGNLNGLVSLIALIVFVVLVSQYIGILKYKVFEGK